MRKFPKWTDKPLSEKHQKMASNCAALLSEDWQWWQDLWQSHKFEPFIGRLKPFLDWYHWIEKLTREGIIESKKDGNRIYIRRKQP